MNVGMLRPNNNPSQRIILVMDDKCHIHNIYGGCNENNVEDSHYCRWVLWDHPFGAMMSMCKGIVGEQARVIEE